MFFFNFGLFLAIKFRKRCQNLELTTVPVQKLFPRSLKQSLDDWLLKFVSKVRGSITFCSYAHVDTRMITQPNLTRQAKNQSSSLRRIFNKHES